MRKRKYLRHLIVVLTILLIVPTVTIFDLLWMRSDLELESANRAYYEQMIDSYVTSFDDTIVDLNYFAARISSDSKLHNNIFWTGVESLRENYHGLYEAVLELNDRYKLSDVPNWGIYLYDIDKILKPGSTLSSEQFIFHMQNVYGENPELYSFLSPDSYQLSKNLFCSYYSTQKNDGYLLIGYCIKLGRENDPALVYFKISPKDMEESLVILENEKIEFYLIDDSTMNVSLAWGGNAGDNIDELFGDDIKYDAVDEEKIYHKKCRYAAYSILAYVSEGTLQDSIVRYSEEMRIILAIAIVFFISTCAAVLYITYRPILKLTDELEYTEGGEFELIRNVLDTRQSKILEQEMLILDLLLNNLLNGIHVPAERLAQLGLDNTFKYHCVYLLEGRILSNAEEELLIRNVMRLYHARLFVTDLQGEKQSVFIACMTHDNHAEIGDYLSEWSRKQHSDNCHLRIGCLVDNLDAIQSSYLHCVNQQKIKIAQDKRIALAEENEKTQLQMRDDIIAYLNEHFTDANLSQVQIADYFHVSNYTLSRLFKKYIGIGFAEFLSAKRVEYAKELLLTTDMTINDISSSAGFASRAYFSRSFKMYVGMSPTEYRQLSAQDPKE